jgi:hypothetical protein
LGIGSLIAAAPSISFAIRRRAMLQMLWSFAPFIVFALLSRTTAIELNLWAAAMTSAGLIAREQLVQGKSIKMLEAGTVLLFGLLALYTTLTHAHWSIAPVRTVVDAGLLLIIVVSLAIRQPFTLQYAREQVAPDVQQSPAFLSINSIITGVWAAALAVVVVADLAMEYMPAIPLWIDTAVLVAALAAAIRFSRWYPEQRRRAFAGRAKAVGTQGSVAWKPRVG